jgi:hypothetical protein
VAVHEQFGEQGYTITVGPKDEEKDVEFTFKP